MIEALGDRVTRLDQGRRHADARCPAHDDQNPSLTVDWKHNPAKGGLVTATCHSTGCSFADILAAIGLSMVDAFDNDRPGYTRRQPAASQLARLAGRRPDRSGGVVHFRARLIVCSVVHACMLRSCRTASRSSAPRAALGSRRSRAGSAPC